MLCVVDCVSDAHRDDGKRFLVRADEKLTAFVELGAAIRLSSRQYDKSARTVLLQRDRFLGLFNKLLEARIAAERVPPRTQFQVAIAERGWEADNAVQLFKGEVFVTNPRRDQCQILDRGGASDRIFSNGRSSTALRPSRSASSLRPSPASIKPRTHIAGA